MSTTAPTEAVGSGAPNNVTEPAAQTQLTTALASGTAYTRVDLPPPRALPEADEARVAAAVRGLPLPWRTLFALALDTGLRAGELTGLRVRDVQWTPGSEGLRVEGKGGAEFVGR